MRRASAALERLVIIMASTHKIIAKAIRKADKSYFFEDYTKQAKSVLLALEKEGLVIAPKAPTQEMEDAGAEAILSGKIKPHTLVRQIYEAMTASLGK